MGQNRHLLTFPVEHGRTMNMVAFATNDRAGWVSTSKLTIPSTKAEALDDFREFGQNVKNIIQLAPDKLERVSSWGKEGRKQEKRRMSASVHSFSMLIQNPSKLQWAIFDLGDHPLSSYYKGRICLVGDAAHATSPHHGAGAGLCIEDAAVLADLLADPAVKTPGHVEVVFAVFDAQRRQRTQWLVRSSRRAGNLYEWLARDIGRDFVMMERELKERLDHIWGFDLEDSLREATKDLHRRLSVPGVHKLDSQVMPFYTNEQDGVETQ